MTETIAGVKVVLKKLFKGGQLTRLPGRFADYEPNLME